MRKTISRNLPFLGLTTLILALLGGSCLPKSPGERGDVTITLYGFSVMKESLEKAIFPGHQFTEPIHSRRSERVLS